MDWSRDWTFPQRSLGPCLWGSRWISFLECRMCGDRSCSQEQLLVCGRWLFVSRGAEPSSGVSRDKAGSPCTHGHQGLLSEGERRRPSSRRTFALRAVSTVPEEMPLLPAQMGASGRGTRAASEGATQRRLKPLSYPFPLNPGKQRSPTTRPLTSERRSLRNVRRLEPASPAYPS